ncbi:MAG TPA: hypothetical protein VJ772_06410 [Nitrososphaeraceae archaeon]|nr:hypothetical protein [Nitrososphaeraceae archaeon]
MQDRRKKILELIKEKPGIIKAEVIRHMEKNGSSVMTTHGIVMDLIKDGQIIEHKDKPNSQVHHLYINDQNNFIILDKKISRMQEFIKTLNQRMDNAHDDAEFDLFRDWIVETVWKVLNVTPSLLFFLTQKTVHSEQDRQILYLRIITLMIETNTFAEKLKVIGITLSTIMDEFVDFRLWNKYHPEYVPLNENLKEIMIDFKKDINRYMYNQLSLDEVIFKNGQ